MKIAPSVYLACSLKQAYHGKAGGELLPFESQGEQQTHLEETWDQILAWPRALGCAGSHTWYRSWGNGDKEGCRTVAGSGVVRSFFFSLSLS